MPKEWVSVVVSSSAHTDTRSGSYQFSKTTITNKAFSTFLAKKKVESFSVKTKKATFFISFASLAVVLVAVFPL